MSSRSGVGRRVSHALLHNPFRFRLAALVVGIFIAGCRTLPVDPPPASLPAATIDPHFPLLSGQYVSQETETPLYEIFVVNASDAPLTFTGVTLAGRRLTQPAAALLGRQAISLGGKNIPLPAAPPDPQLIWWQFYPSAVIAPQGSAALQLCFREAISTPLELELVDDCGNSQRHTIPVSGRQQLPAINAITYSHDLTHIYLKYDHHPAPLKTVWLNGRPITPTQTLRTSAPDSPVVLELPPPHPLKAGQPLDIRLLFTDHKTSRALVRVLPGITLDAPHNSGRRSRHVPLTLSNDPHTLMISIDATCDDLRAGTAGANAWPVIAAGQKNRREHPAKLSGFAYCTGRLPQTHAIYGRIADFIYSKPYQLGWGGDQSRFLDLETNLLLTQRDSAAPRPFIYIPERFATGGRHISPDELELLQWTALAAGAKGLRWHFALNQEGINTTPDLIPVLQRAGAEIRRLEPLLAPLIPISSETQGNEEEGYLQVLTAWSGTQGALYLIRNRAYTANTTDAAHHSPIPVTLTIPPWCHGSPLLDLRDQSTILASASASPTLDIAATEAYRLLWISARNTSLSITHKGETE